MRRLFLSICFSVLFSTPVFASDWSSLDMSASSITTALGSVNTFAKSKWDSFSTDMKKTSLFKTPQQISDGITDVGKTGSPASVMELHFGRFGGDQTYDFDWGTQVFLIFSGLLMVPACWVAFRIVIIGV